MEALVVIDLQNDFISGALGREGNEKIVEPIKELVENFDGEVVFTRDTHEDDYLESLEGKHLPVTHCIKNSEGRQIPFDTKDKKVIDKPTFGSLELADYLKDLDEREGLSKVTFVGICTDICVVSNAIIVKNALPKTEINVKKDLCRGTSTENEEATYKVLEACQVNLI